MGLKGYRVLEDLHNCNLKVRILYVIASRDNAIENDYFDVIKNFCGDNNYVFFERGINQLPDVDFDFCFAIGWRWLIKSNLDKLIVFHDSLLPKYRGFNPLVTALIEGDKEIGVTAIKANESFDCGNILGRKSIYVEYPIKIEFAIKVISTLYGELAVALVNKIITNSIVEEEQNDSIASYSLWRNFNDYFIDWTWPSDKIKRFIDAVGYPYSGARTTVEGLELIVNDSEVVREVFIVNNSPGKILFFDRDNPVICCGKGLLMIKNVFVAQGNTPYKFKNLRIKLK